MTSRAENRIHVALMLALGAANLAILLRGPFEGALPSDEAARSALAEPLVEASRPEIDAGVQRLQSWLARARESSAGAPEQALALQGLGPLAEDRAHPERWLARLLGREKASAWLAPAPESPAPTPEGQRMFAAALVILLESGIPLTQPLEIAATDPAEKITLGDLVRRALDADPSPGEKSLGAPDDPDNLDLLSLAVLGGLSQYRDRLTQAAHGTQRRLTLAQRERAVPVGTGLLRREQLVDLARAWHGASGGEPPGAVDLHASAALFRAAAVLEDPILDAAARPHLGALIARYYADRTLYLYLEASAPDARSRSRARLQTLENLGRFEEALYNAYLSFRGEAGAPPPPDTAGAMRLAAHDLLARLAVLDTASEAHDESPEQHRLLLQAAVHALRGLRTARLGAS